MFDTEVNMLLVLGECQKNYRRAVVMFFERYGIKKSHVSFYNLEKRLREHGKLRTTTHNKRKSITNERNSADVLSAITLNPHVSQRELARASGISRSSIQRILKENRYHPYHLIPSQELLVIDYERRITFCEWIHGAMEDNDFLCKILFSDEATFMNSGHVNRHNMHYWAVENPHWMRSIPFQHRWSLTVWCGIIGNLVIGPYFFEETVRSNSYCNLLQNHLPALLENVSLHIRRKMWFQQDGAPPHFANTTKQLLYEKFGDKWIGRGGPVEWPPRSPDLTPLDFFLWGYVKEKVMFEPPTTKENMKQRIRNACASVTSEMLQNVRNNLLLRINTCLQVHGGHFEHLIH